MDQASDLSWVVIADALQAGWLISHPVDLAGWQARLPGVDEGEASALCLAAQFTHALLIIDDRVGRAHPPCLARKRLLHQ